MSKASRQVAARICCFALITVNGDGTCDASSLLKMTRGIVEHTQSRLDITLFGNTSRGQPFLFSVRAVNGNFPGTGPYLPGDDVFPMVLATSGDFAQFSLAINGEDIELNGVAGPLFRAGSIIEMDGPSVTLPDPFIPDDQFLETPVSFSLEFNLYDDFDFGSPPVYTIASTGFGNANFVFEDRFFEPFGPNSYELTELTYFINPTVPEPDYGVAWHLLFGALTATALRRCQSLRYNRAGVDGTRERADAD